MDKSKIKNFIILLLAIVNIFLLFIVLKNAANERETEKYKLEALESVLAENGIVLSKNVELPKKIPTEITLSRNLMREKRKISALIGSSDAQDLGGNIFYYNGSTGQANSRGTGEFELMLTGSEYPLDDEPLKICQSAVKKRGIEVADMRLKSDADDSAPVVIMTCAWNGTPIYNAAIRFDFTIDRLFIISGMRPLDTEVSVREYESYSDSVTVLMSFLEYIRQANIVCSEIINVELGYYSSVSASGSCVLRPVWCIETDTGEYYINAQTGRPEGLDYSM